MDVNGTHFHLLLGHDDWGNCFLQEDGTQPVYQAWSEPSHHTGSAGSNWNHEQGALTLRPYLYWIADSVEPAFQWRDRRGAACDRSGNWYWIDRSRREILASPSGGTGSLHFWSFNDGVAYATLASSSDLASQTEEQAPSSASPLSGLTITDDSFLVVGLLEPAGLLIFDLLAASLPVQLFWPSAVPFAPFDMAPRPGGGAWILDRDHARYWALDRNFHVLRRDQPELFQLSEQIELFQMAGAGEAVAWRVSVTQFPEGFALLADSTAPPGTPLSAMAIEALPDGTVLILANTPDEPFASVYHYHLDQQRGKPVSTGIMSRLVEQDQLAAFRLSGYDFAFVPTHTDEGQNAQPDRLYVITPEGRQVYAFNIWQQHNQLTLDALPAFYPAYFFGGKALVAAGNELFYDCGDSWLPLMAQPITRHTTCATLYTPAGETHPPLDGNMPGCVWHRLLLDASIPAETTVQIWSRASDSEEDLVENDWQQEPNFYLRDDGSELPFVEEPEGEDTGTWELLFQAARGRYLQLKITLTSDGVSTPGIRALRIYYPRFSYLQHYLPAVYSQNSHSASFLDRFLANVEGFYTTIEGRIAAAQMLFDPRSAPAGALAWLASWFDASLDVTWDIPKQRFFLRHAMEYFQCRGTLRGLQMILQLTFDTYDPAGDSFDEYLKQSERVCGIRIVEKFRTRHAPGALLGDPTDPNGTNLAGEHWTPDKGGRALLARYRRFLQQSGMDSGTLKKITAFPLARPAEERQAFAWMDISHDVLGFVPDITRHPQRWQRFLKRRYLTIAALNYAYQSDFTAFEDVQPFQNLPPDGQPLQDWYQFETIVLATYSAAHQFSVLLPMPSTGDTRNHYQQLELAARIVEKEKPAHTVFEVKFYRAAFSIGAVRLGFDTFVDLGSRTPDLISPLILGESYIAESYVTTGQSYALAHRDGARRGERDE